MKQKIYKTDRYREMNPKVSVIIPVYNAENYIKECLDSVLSQSLPELEVLCIDDCSTDRSVEVISQEALRDARVVLIRNECNMGAGETRNRGIALAKGKYFFFLDADDFLAEDAVEKLYERSEQHSLQLCFCPHAVYDETNGSLRKSPQTTDVFLKRYQNRVFSFVQVRRFLYQNIFCVPWNRLYLTEFVRNSPVRFPRLRNSEDFFFGDAIVTEAVRMGTVEPEGPLVYYRMGREGQVSSTLGKNPLCMTESVRLLHDYLIQNHRLAGMERSYHTIALDVLLFSVSAAGASDSLKSRMAERGFAETGMAGLSRGDFANAASYKTYLAFLEGRLTAFDPYMTSVKEDREKCEKVRAFLEEHRREKTALWGMSKRGQALLNAVSTGRGFDCYIDENPGRGKEAPGGAAVRKYEEIAEPLDYVMISNAKYYEEIYTRCRRRNPECRVIDLDTFFRCDMSMEECMA